MPHRVRLLALIAVSLGAWPACAADQWYLLAAPRFEVYALAGDPVSAGKNAREALTSFEDVRAVMARTLHMEWDQPAPTRIVSFQTSRQFKPFAPNAAGGTYASNAESRDYFILTESDADHLPVGLHQYVHLVLQRAGWKLPVWLSEGLAEMFSNLKPGEGSALVGTPLKDHVEELKSVKWLDINALTAVDEKSPLYNEGNRNGQFYAESWALVHMLCLGQHYGDQFAKMLGAFEDGKSTAEAWQLAYGRTPAQVYADLQAYVKNPLLAASFPIAPDAGADAAPRAATELESGLVTADLLSAMNRKDQAAAAYEKLSKQFPAAPELAESLGYQALRNGDAGAARRYFEQALPETKDPQMCYHLAMVYHDSGERGDKLIAALAKAVSLKPDYADARFQLGLAQYNRGDYRAAIAALAPIQSISPDHAAMLYSALGFAYLQTGDTANARKSLEAGRKWNKTDADRQKSDQLEQYLNGR